MQENCASFTVALFHLETLKTTNHSTRRSPDFNFLSTLQSDLSIDLLSASVGGLAKVEHGIWKLVISFKHQGYSDHLQLIMLIIIITFLDFFYIFAFGNVFLFFCWWSISHLIHRNQKRKEKYFILMIENSRMTPIDRG